MKLYATVSSERASKGQGGNKFIRIELLSGSKTVQTYCGLIEMQMMNDEKYTQIVYYDPNKNGEPTIIGIVGTKGNKQTGEVKDCKLDGCMGAAYQTGYCKRHS